MATSPSKASSLALHFAEKRPDPSKSSPSLMSQMQHRISLVSFWAIQPGSRILELGCGQGDTTIVLADTVGPTGHIDAIDPGSPSYGSPFTLSQAQSHISATPLGPRISFHLATPPTTYLESYTGPKYDYIVLSHCTYYFSSPSVLPTLIQALTPHLSPTTKLCLAEWSLTTSSPSPQSSFPHILTALLLSTLESHRLTPSNGNIRTVLSPTQISTSITQNSPLVLIKQDIRTPNEDLQDGFWEVGYLLRRREKEMKMLGEAGVGERERVVVGAMFDAVEGSVEAVGGVEGVRCMDYWVAVFGRGGVEGE